LVMEPLNAILISIGRGAQKLIMSLERDLFNFLLVLNAFYLLKNTPDRIGCFEHSCNNSPFRCSRRISRKANPS
jgi:hypothetical protein